MKEMTDDRLWTLCLEGDVSAVEQLYRRYYFKLYNYGCKCTTDREVVRNTIHDLFVKIISGYKMLSPTRYVNEYLFKAFRRRLFDVLKERRIVFLDDLSVLAEMNMPDEYLSDKDDYVRMMREAYRNLTFNQRRVIFLYYICEMSHGEISEILGINYQSSKNLLHRSVVQLRQAFMKKL